MVAFFFPMQMGSNTLFAEFLGSSVNNTSGSSFTFSGESLGVASTSREIFVAVSWGKDTGVSIQTLSSATIGGVSATIHVQDGRSGTSQSLGAAMISAVVPTGATGNIVCTFTGVNTSCGIGKFRVLNRKSLTATTKQNNSSSSPVTTSVNIDVAQNGALMAAYMASEDPGTVTWTNITKQYEGGSSASYHYSGALSTGLASQVGRNITTSQSTSGTAGVVVAVVSIA